VGGFQSLAAETLAVARELVRRAVSMPYTMVLIFILWTGVQGRWLLAVGLVLGTVAVGWLVMWSLVLSSIPFFRCVLARRQVPVPAKMRPLAHVS
jgi:hypothetical protein